MPGRIELIAFEQQVVAQALVNYLQSQGIDASQRHTKHQSANDQPKGYLITLSDAKQHKQAVAITKHFIAHPNDPKYKLNKGQLNFPLFGIDAFKQTPFTWLIILCCLLVFVFFNLAEQRWVGQQLSILPFSALNYSGQWWRIITPSFLHFSTIHIGFNVLVWWQLGRLIEYRLGSVTLAVVFLVTAILSNFAQLFTSGIGFGGLSGVVYGLIGFAWLCGLMAPKLGIRLPTNFVIFALAWLVFGYFDLLWIKLANAAHTGGFVVGCITAAIFVWAPKAKRS
jgi:GlpG protein